MASITRALVVAGVVFGAWGAGADAAPAPPPPEPVVDEDAASSLVPVPPGCPVPEPADVAFVGTVDAKDAYIDKGTVRFRIDQVRAGSASPFSVRGLIDVRYGPDSKYLDVGEQYLVGARVDPEIGALASKVAPEAPLFGGDAVVGLEDTAVECLEIDDPVMTLNADGSSVESGVLSPLFDDRRLLLATFGVPAAIIAVVLIGLVLLRRVWGWGVRGVLELGRAAVTPTPDHVAARVRHHRDEPAAAFPRTHTASGPDGSDRESAPSVFGVWRSGHHPRPATNRSPAAAADDVVESR